jgi:hypothetical protein
LLVLSAALLMFACAPALVEVHSVPPSLAIESVCIKVNAAVQDADFLPVLQHGFGRHRIATRMIDEHVPEDCEFVVSYTARRSWDLKSYLSHAELRIDRQGREIGSAVYHLKNKGGFSTSKFDSTREKIDPIIDQLLATRSTAASAH